MKLSDYRTLIQSLPVRQQCFTVKRDNKKWLRAEKKYDWFKKLNDKYFEKDKPAITISRQDIFNIKQPVRELIIKTIYWGYPYGMQGHKNFNGILQEINTIENALTDLKAIESPNEADYRDLHKIFSNINGLGLSTFSKFLYFSGIEFSGNPSLILDQRLTDTFKNGYFEEFEELHQLNENINAHYYLTYLKITNHLADQLETKGENIELFLFLFGKTLKPE